MKENIFTHKFLPVFSAILLCFFIFFVCNVSAAEYSPDLIVKAEQIAGSNNFCLATEGDGSVVWLFVLPSDTSRFFLKDNKLYCYITDNEYGSIPCYYLDNDGNFKFAVYNDYLLNIFTFRYSTIDIFDGDIGSEIFFQKTPVAVIPALEEVEQIPEAMATVLKLIIPVSLIVLSAVLLIYLVRSRIYRAL